VVAMVPCLFIGSVSTLLKNFYKFLTAVWPIPFFSDVVISCRLDLAHYCSLN
jgi:hypothetical protein